MVHDKTAAASPYALGHQADELERLTSQHRYFGDLTAELFRHAGLEAGLRVLDIGCGVGDVSFVAAGILGSSGSVVGVDRAPEAIEVARGRAVQAGLDNVTFVPGDIADLTLDETVDAIVGRLILMYLPDPAAALRQLTRNLRPGGLVIMQEFDMAAATSEPACPLFDASIERMRATFRRAGASDRMGLRLAPVFRDAGLPVPTMLMHARVEEGPARATCEQLTFVTRSLLPLMERTGIASAQDVDIETLAARISTEAAERQSTLVSPAFIGAWARSAASHQ
jgi:ubiquinone/menaquinone biosynthesis C-methylase UbiE